MKVAVVDRRPGHIPWGALLMAPLWFLPLGAWAVETGRIDLGTCSMKMVAGLPCWSCGSTRGTIRLLHGDLGAAIAYQPLMMTIYLVLLVWGIVSLAAFWKGKRVLLDANRGEVWGFRIALVALPLLNWWYLIEAGI